MKLLAPYVILLVVCSVTVLAESESTTSDQSPVITSPTSTGTPTENSNVSNAMDDQSTQKEEEMQELIKQVVLQLRNESEFEIPGVEIPDPMPVPDANMNINSGSTQGNLQTWNVTIAGLSRFSVDEIDANLNDMNITIGLNLSTIKVDGQYYLKGKYSFFRLTGNGDFWMKLFNCTVVGSLSLKLNPDGYLEVNETNVEFYVQNIRLHFANFLRNGTSSNFTNTILNAFSRIIFENMKPFMLEKLESEMINILNEKFRDAAPQPPLARKKSPLDVAIANSATFMRENGFDPFPVPDFQENFRGKFLIIRFNGSISLFNGYVNGLSTIHRTGPIQVTYKDKRLVANAELGFQNLEGGYKWDATLMKLRRKGGVHFNIKELNLLLRITQENKKKGYPRIDELKIVNIQKLLLDMDGLGSLDFLIEFFTNFFTNVFKKQFALITETNVKKIIQKNLESVQIPY